MLRLRDSLKMMVRINCFILIATTNISLAVGIGYLVCEGSGFLYFEENKHFNDRPIVVSWLILKVFIISMMISAGFQLIAMSFLTIWKKCRRTRTLERQHEIIEIPIISLMNGRRVVNLERPYGRNSDAYTVTLV